jgi:hypothetical protein
MPACQQDLVRPHSLSYMLPHGTCSSYRQPPDRGGPFVAVPTGFDGFMIYRRVRDLAAQDQDLRPDMVTCWSRNHMRSGDAHGIPSHVGNAWAPCTEGVRRRESMGMGVIRSPGFPSEDILFGK